MKHRTLSCDIYFDLFTKLKGRGPRAMVKAACLESRRMRVRTPLRPPSFKEKKNVSSPRTRKDSILWGDREVACSASDPQGSNFKSCVWRAVSSHSSRHPQEVLLAQFSLYVHRGGLKPHSFHSIFTKLKIYLTNSAFNLINI